MWDHTQAHEERLIPRQASRKNWFSLRRAALLVLLSTVLTADLALGQANLQGSWQTLSNTMPINPIHAALLRNGKVLVVAGSGNVPSNTTYQAGVWDPATGATTTQSLAWDMFCNGMVILPDGRPFVVGGTVAYDPFRGQTKSAVYSPSSGQFTDVETMAHGRWYPTVTTLSDGTVMAFSGLNEASATNSAVEIYTPGSGWSQEYSAGWTPPLYPRLHLLPNGNVFYSGSSNTSMMFDTSAHTWSTVAVTNYTGSNRVYGSSVLLSLTPANGYTPRVMIFGGGTPATATTEIIDLSSDSPSWKWGPPMSQPRIEMNAVLLPNGKVLTLGGSASDEDATTASLNADLFAADGSTVSPAGQNAFPRMYHSVALLLPDARVWVAGGNPQRGSYEPHMEIYSPPYLFAADGSLASRPTITSVSSVIGYGNTFQVQTPDAASIASAALMRAGSVTHAFDMDQRLVGMSFTAGTGVLTVSAPPDGNTAPPGYYLLFLLNSAGVPSVGSFVQLTSAAPNPDFSIAASPATQTVVASQSTTYKITGNSIAGFSGTVIMSVSGLPSGATGTFSPPTVSGAGSTTLTVSTGLMTPLGNYLLTITGSSGTTSHTAQVNVMVVGAPSPPPIGN